MKRFQQVLKKFRGVEHLSFDLIHPDLNYLNKNDFLCSVETKSNLKLITFLKKIERTRKATRDRDATSSLEKIKGLTLYSWILKYPVDYKKLRKMCPNLNSLTIISWRYYFSCLNPTCHSQSILNSGILKNLKFLQLSVSRVFPSIIRQILLQCVKIETLVLSHLLVDWDIYGGNSINDMVEPILRLEKIHTLRLPMFTKFDMNVFLTILYNLPSLREFSVNLKKHTDVGYMKIFCMTENMSFNLIELVLRMSKNIQYEIFDILFKMLPKLKRFGLSDCAMDDKIAEKIMSNKLHLTTLFMNIDAKNLNPKGLNFISQGCPNIEVLGIKYSFSNLSLEDCETFIKKLKFLKKFFYEVEYYQSIQIFGMLRLTFDKINFIDKSRI